MAWPTGLRIRFIIWPVLGLLFVFAHLMSNRITPLQIPKNLRALSAIPSKPGTLSTVSARQAAILLRLDEIINHPTKHFTERAFIESTDVANTIAWGKEFDRNTVHVSTRYDVRTNTSLQALRELGPEHVYLEGSTVTVKIVDQTDEHVATKPFLVTTDYFVHGGAGDVSTAAMLTLIDFFTRPEIPVPIGGLFFLFTNSEGGEVEKGLSSLVAAHHDVSVPNEFVASYESGSMPCAESHLGLGEWWSRLLWAVVQTAGSRSPASTFRKKLGMHGIGLDVCNQLTSDQHAKLRPYHETLARAFDAIHAVVEQRPAAGSSRGVMPKSWSPSLNTIVWTSSILVYLWACATPFVTIVFLGEKVHIRNSFLLRELLCLVLPVPILFMTFAATYAAARMMAYVQALGILPAYADSFLGIEAMKWVSYVVGLLVLAQVVKACSRGLQRTPETWSYFLSLWVFAFSFVGFVHFHQRSNDHGSWDLSGVSGCNFLFFLGSLVHVVSILARTWYVIYLRRNSKLHGRTKRTELEAGIGIQPILATSAMFEEISGAMSSDRGNHGDTKSPPSSQLKLKTVLALSIAMQFFAQEHQWVDIVLRAAGKVSPLQLAYSAFLCLVPFAPFTHSSTSRQHLILAVLVGVLPIFLRWCLIPTDPLGLPAFEHSINFTDGVAQHTIVGNRFLAHRVYPDAECHSLGFSFISTCTESPEASSKTGEAYPLVLSNHFSKDGVLALQLYAPGAVNCSVRVGNDLVETTKDEPSPLWENQAYANRYGFTLAHLDPSRSSLKREGNADVDLYQLKAKRKRGSWTARLKNEKVEGMAECLWEETPQETVMRGKVLSLPESFVVTKPFSLDPA